MWSDDNLRIMVRLTYKGKELAYAHVVSKEELDDFGLRPIKHPFNRDLPALMEYDRLMKRRDEVTRDIGMRIARSISRYLEDQEEPFQ